DIPLNDEDFYATGRIRVLGRPVAPFTERPVVNNTVVSPEFFRTLEIPLKSGRIFDAHDRPRSTETVAFGFVPAEPVVVNTALARFQLILIGTFAAIAILLAAAGVYGTMSYLIARRTREIGIRVAMGATPGHIVRTIVTESTVLLIFAVVAGLGGAWALTRYI